MLWDNGEETWDDLSVMKRYDPMELTKYALDQKLTNTLGSKWGKKFNRASKRTVKQPIRIHALKVQAGKSRRNKFKFSTQVAQIIRHSYHLNMLNRDTKWAGAIAKE